MDPRQRLHMIDLLRGWPREGRSILFSSHILEEVERLADAVLVVYAGRLAASGDFRSIRRLMTDRPHAFTVRSSDDRRAGRARCMAQPAVFGAELVDGRAGRADVRLRGVHPDRRADRAGGRRPRCSRSPRRTTRSRACSATWSADDASSRRSSASRCAACWAGGGLILLVLLAALPVLVALLIRRRRRAAGRGRVLDTLVDPDGPAARRADRRARRPSARRSRTGRSCTSLIKPVPRWRIALAKMRRRGRADRASSSSRRSS